MPDPRVFTFINFLTLVPSLACNDDYLDSALSWNCDLHRQIVALRFAGLLTPGNFD